MRTITSVKLPRRTGYDPRPINCVLKKRVEKDGCCLEGGGILNYCLKK